MLGLRSSVASEDSTHECEFSSSSSRSSTHIKMGMAYGLAGDGANALACVRRADQLLEGAPGLPLTQAWLAAAELLTGDPARARATMVRLADGSQTAFVEPAAIAWVHYALGDHEAAFAELERGYALRSPLMASLLVLRGFMFRDIANDPRYGALLERMGFPQDSSS